MLIDLFPGVPPYVLAAAVLHFAFFLALIIPVWRIFDRAGMGGTWALILLIPAIGLLAVPIMLAAVVLRRAGWPVYWFLAALLPFLNVLFLWIFAYAHWPRFDGPAPARSRAARRRRDEEADFERPRLGALETPPEEEAPAAHSAPGEAEEFQLERTSALRRRTQPMETEETLTPEQAGPEDEAATIAHRRGPQAPRVWIMTGANERSADLRIRVSEEDLQEAAEGLLVGRSSRADFILKDDSVSRNHARLSLRRGKLSIEDLDSMNGTWLNGHKLEPGTPAVVPDGAEVEFGQMKLVVAQS